MRPRHFPSPARESVPGYVNRILVSLPILLQWLTHLRQGRLSLLLLRFASRSAAHFPLSPASVCACVLFLSPISCFIPQNPIQKSTMRLQQVRQSRLSCFALSSSILVKHLK